MGRCSRALWGIAYAPRNPAVRLLAPFDLIFALWLLLFHLALAGVKNYSYLVRNAYENVCFCVCICACVCVIVRLFFGRACGLASRTLGTLDMHRPFFKMVALPFSRHPSLSPSRFPPFVVGPLHKSSCNCNCYFEWGLTANYSPVYGLSSTQNNR